MGEKRKQFILMGVLGLIVILMSILSPDRFLSLYNLQTMAFQLPEFGIIALGMMIVILTGGINLSITSVSALSGIMGAFVLSSHLGETHTLLAILGALAAIGVTAALTGIVNGMMVAYIGVTPILVTLGSKIFFEGICMWLTRGGSISNFPEAYYWFGNESVAGIPVPMLVFAVLSVLTYVLLEKTPWGSRVYMVGSNPNAAVFSGINVKRVLLQVYVYSSLMAGFAAIIMISRYNSAKVDLGSSYLLQSVAAVVLGGTSISGGHGSVLGTILAVAILQVVSSGLNILGVNRFIVDMIMGSILIAVLALNYMSSKRAAKAVIKAPRRAHSS